MDTVIKIYPKPQKLETITTTLRCPEKGCASIFSSRSNLNFHLAKTHKKLSFNKLSANFIKQFYCPDSKCVYNNNLFFKSLKLLKQHYLKVHAQKKFICEKCQKGFPTASTQKSHLQYCGVMFNCKDCSATYPCYETLKTHCRRKKHSVLEKTAYKIIESQTVAAKTIKTSDTRVVVKTRTLLPKPSNLAVFIIPLPSVQYSVVERSSQTDILKVLHRENPVNKKLQVCSETQTPKASNCGVSEKTSVTTQTCSVGHKTVSYNTKSTLSNLKYCETPAVSRNSSGTQTNAINNDFMYFNQVANFDFEPKEPLSAFDSTFFNCNSETQTEFFGNEFFNDCEYYSNMCTQTCDDIFLEELGLNNSHTQTAFDDVVRSVESQTMISQNKKILLSGRDIAHMETQTDSEFKQMLEEIHT